MAYCEKCGAEYNSDAKFCPGCGTKIQGKNFEKQNGNSVTDEEILWEGKPASIGDKAKGAFNTETYTITNQRIIIKWGLIGKKQEEIELVRIDDVSVTQSIGERVQSIGDVTIESNDKTTPIIKLENIKDPFEVKELIRKHSREEKSKLGYRYNERM